MNDFVVWSNSNKTGSKSIKKQDIQKIWNLNQFHMLGLDSLSLDTARTPDFTHFSATTKRRREKWLAALNSQMVF
jgi:hypothetical protein